MASEPAPHTYRTLNKVKITHVKEGYTATPNTPLCSPVLSLSLPNQHKVMFIVKNKKENYLNLLGRIGY